jgi:hypothetical protein
MIGAGALAFAVMGYVISTRRGDRVELNPTLLSFVLGEPVDEIERVIEWLCSPDPKSRRKEKEGRRLVKLEEYLYEVVNGKHYDSIANKEEQLNTDKLRKREERQAVAAANKKAEAEADAVIARAARLAKKVNGAVASTEPPKPLNPEPEDDQQSYLGRPLK